MYIWTDGSGRLELTLTAQDVSAGYHQGQCDDDIAGLLADSRISEQVAKWSHANMASELRGYGAWDDEELADVDACRARLVWLACGAIFDDPDMYAA